MVSFVVIGNKPGGFDYLKLDKNIDNWLALYACIFNMDINVEKALKLIRV